MMKKLSIAFSCMVLLMSCATITSPSGGEKDTEPPVLLSANPEIGTTNFTKNSFELKFDEFLTQIDYGNEILVSPEIKTLKSSYMGKRIKFSWKEELKENTTYTFQFLNNLKDFNEGNILAGFLYTFSTGPIIDSLTISGQIINSTYTPSEELKVNLVTAKDFTDTTYVEGGFNFGSFSDKHGHFSFSYLPSDEFYIYGFEDKNGNKKWDEDGERIAFFPHTIESSDSTHVAFELFMEEKPAQFTQAKHSGFNKIELVFEDVLPDTDSVELFSDNQSLSFQKFVEKDKVELVFNESLGGDSLCVMVNGTDTLPFYKVRSSVPNIDLSLETEHIIKDEAVVIKANYPIAYLDTTKIKTTINADSVIYHSVRLLEDQRTIELSYEDDGSPVNIVIQDSALVYQDSIFNKAFNKPMVRKTLEDFAVIQCVFTPQAYPLIVQLHSAKDELLSEQILPVGKTKMAFDRIWPGRFKLRYIVDQNADGRFTSGSIKALRQPERIVLYKNEIQLKPNWITEIVFPE